MKRKPPLGLFITGTDTDVGKTYVTALIARQLVAAGMKVGVYKPVASGCRSEKNSLICEDAVKIWEAAGKPETLARVCPQRFAAPVAPHLAAQAEGKTLDAKKLRSGLEFWADRCEIVLVEGSGGFMSPLGRDEYVADLADQFGYPLVIVAPNRLGVINQALQTVITSQMMAPHAGVAGIVLSDVTEDKADVSRKTNLKELQARVSGQVYGLKHGAEKFSKAVKWAELAVPADPNHENCGCGEGHDHGHDGHGHHHGHDRG